MNIYFHFSIISFSNSYIVSCNKTKTAIIIDPGNLSSDMISCIEDNKLTVKAILLTHYNPFFSKAIKTILKIYDAEIYTFYNLNASYKTIKVNHGQKLSFGNLVVECIHVPGPTSDSIVYKIDDALFTGVALSSGSISENELPKTRALHLKMICQRLLNLDSRSLIFPGYGPPTTLFVEKLFNHDLLEAITSDDLLHLSHSSIIVKN